MIDRDKFYDAVRADPFGGGLTQSQVDGMNTLLDVWEVKFEQPNPNDGVMWLGYCLATTFHETDRTMRPIEEYDKSQPYAQPTGKYGNCYYGRGHVMLTHPENYEKGEACLFDRYELHVPMYKYPHRMLEDETSALVLFDGMIYGWFTGVGLPTYFSKARGIEDPYNARRIVNGLDCASKIEGYYWSFKAALAA